MPTFRPDRAFYSGLMHSAGLEPVLRERAEAVAARARQLAPRETGALANSISTEVALTDRGWRARVNAWDYKAHWIEFGTVRAAARPFLRPALRAQRRAERRAGQ